MAPTLFSEASPLDTSVFRLSTPVKRRRPMVTESLLAAVIAATPLDVRLGGLRRVHVWGSAPPPPSSSYCHQPFITLSLALLPFHPSLDFANKHPKSLRAPL